MLVKSQVKYIQSLGQKKFRSREGMFIAEGPRIVKELLENNSSMVKQVFALKDWIDENKESTGNSETIEISASDLERISKLTTPNKVLAIVQQLPADHSFDTKNRITLALDTIQDPGNLGTIIRTADWFGVEQIVCSEDCVEMYNPKVVQSTMGSIARVKFIYTGLATWMADHPGTKIYAATLDGNDITAMNRLQEGIIVIGNESSGIDPEILQLANERITIPGKGKAESLNAAVAAGIILSYLS